MAVVGTTVGTADAQSISTQVFDSTIPFSYERGRNESVTQRAHPEYTPEGIPVGAFSLYPQLSTSVGYTNNAYQVPVDSREADGFGVIAPSVSLRSDWAIHSIQVDARGEFARFFTLPQRNEDSWTLGAAGELEVGRDSSLRVNGRTSQRYANYFSGVDLARAISAREVRTNFVSAVAETRLTRVRGVLSADYSTYRYSPIRIDSGILDQSFQNRSITRLAGQVEYGLTPDAGIFAQLGYIDTSYDRDIATGVANRDSSEKRALGGVSMDISALIRGSLGVGYFDRRYRSPVYTDISGFSFDGRIEYFMTPLTTVTLTMRQQAEDAAIVGTSGYINTGGALRIDHELLRNLILSLGMDYEHDRYRGIDATNDIVRAASTARYMLSKRLQLDGTVGYNSRTSTLPQFGRKVDELRAVIGLTIRP